MPREPPPEPAPRQAGPVVDPPMPAVRPGPGASMPAAREPPPRSEPPAHAGGATGAGSIQVQLVAAGSEADANAAWQRLAGRRPDLMQGRAPEVIRAEVGGHAVWRLRTGGFAHAGEARAFCAQATGAGAECWVVGGGV